LLINIVQARYSDLAEFAQRQVGRIDKPDVLGQLIQQGMSAPNADVARRLLEVGTETQARLWVGIRHDPYDVFHGYDMLSGLAKGTTLRDADLCLPSNSL
jgi:hypothetical protein